MAGSLTIRGVVFEHIPLEDIRAAYTNIESDLYEVTKKSHADWIPADVYSALRNGSADLYVVYKDEEYAGFLVTTTPFGVSMLILLSAKPLSFIAKFKHEI